MNFLLIIIPFLIFVQGGESTVPMELDGPDMNTDSALQQRDGSNTSDNDVSVNYSMEHAYSTASKTPTSKYFEGNLTVSYDNYFLHFVLELIGQKLI